MIMPVQDANAIFAVFAVGITQFLAVDGNHLTGRKTLIGRRGHVCLTEATPAAVPRKLGMPAAAAVDICL